MFLPTALIILAALSALAAIRAALNTVFVIKLFAGRSRARSIRDSVLYLALTTLLVTAAAIAR